MSAEKEATGRAGSDDGRKATALLIGGVSLLTIACALLVALVLVGNADTTSHEVKPVAGGTAVTLTKAEARGRELFGETCASCHVLKAANAVGTIGPNLDQMKPDAALVRHAIEFGRSNGRGEMPGGLYTGTDAEEIAAFVAVATGGGGREG